MRRPTERSTDLSPWKDSGKALIPGRAADLFSRLGSPRFFSSLDFYPLTDMDLPVAECITAHPLALSSRGGSR
jgi:hypothetical protein